MATTDKSHLSPAKVAHSVRRGVALYSYQEELFVGQMNLEDCLRECSDIGAHSIEVLAEMVVPDFPNPGEAWIEKWHEWMARYRLNPVCYTQFIDTLRTKSHNLTVTEGVQTMLRDIRLAKQLGIRKIRALIGTPVDILEATVPHLEKEGVWMGVELHAPIAIGGRLVERLLKIADKTDSLGFVPDLGIFQSKPNPYARDRAIRDGRLGADAAAHIETSWAARLDKAKVSAEIAKMASNAGAQAYLDQIYEITPQNPRDLEPIMAKCRHIHGKTWGLTEDCVDPVIDLTNVIPALVEGGFDGVIATEYEGQRLVQDVSPFSEVEMIRRHHVMLRRMLGA